MIVPGWYVGRENVLSAVIDSGAIVPMAFVMAAEAVMRDDQNAVVMAYSRSDRWVTIFVGNKSIGKLKPRHEKMLLEAGGAFLASGGNRIGMVLNQ